MNDQAAAAIAEAAEAVGEAAREQKRAAAFHRRRVAEMLQRFEALQRVCAEHGIEITVNAQSRGGHGNDRRDQHTDG